MNSISAAFVSVLLSGVASFHVAKTPSTERALAGRLRYPVDHELAEEFEVSYDDLTVDTKAPAGRVTLVPRDEPQSFAHVLSDSSDGFFLALNNVEVSKTSSDAHSEVFAAALVDWTVLLSFTIVAFVFDAMVLSRFMEGITGHFIVFMIWVLLAVAYNVMVVSMHGAKMGVQWWTAYLFEWLLNVDNLFIFIIVFGAFRTPHALRAKAMLYWVPFAITLRILLFTIMKDAFDLCGLLKIACGLMLIWSAYEASKGEEDDEFDVDSLKSVQCFRWLLGQRGLSEYDDMENALFVEKSGKWCATMLVLVVFTLSIVDFFFVFDSVAAKVAQIPSQYIANSAEVVALFGMRSFIVFLEDVVETFELLKFGICLVLAFLGAQLVLGGAVPGHFDISPMQSVRVICLILATSAVMSKVKVNLGGEQKDADIGGDEFGADAKKGTKV